LAAILPVIAAIALLLGKKLATKGVNNETPHAQVQYVVPIGEDTDARVYELRDGEETKAGSWNGDSVPERTYVMKDGDNLAAYLS
jgi:hypothetical protein